MLNETTEWDFAATFLSTVVGAVRPRSPKTCHYGSEFLQCGRKGKKKKTWKFNMKKMYCLYGWGFFSILFIFFDTLYRIWHVCREEQEEDESGLKVLLLCRMHFLHFSLRRWKVNTAPDQNHWHHKTTRTPPAPDAASDFMIRTFHEAWCPLKCTSDVLEYVSSVFPYWPLLISWSLELRGVEFGTNCGTNFLHFHHILQMLFDSVTKQCGLKI